VLQVSGSHGGIVYNACRYMGYLIDHVIVEASTELCGGVLSFGISPPLLARPARSVLVPLPVFEGGRLHCVERRGPTADAALCW
jgi:hypothetical protein